MTKTNNLLKSIVTLLSIVMVCTCIAPSLKVSAEKIKSRVIVSMGDSYSSGEGIPDFYGQVDKNGNKRSTKEKAEDPSGDWIAHRSTHAWSGQLALPEVGYMNEHRDENWYFVASSGATTKDIDGKQEKKIKDGSYSEKKKLDPQIDVLKKLNNEGIEPDYVTLTLGGNDAGFEAIIVSAALTQSYISPCILQDVFKMVWAKFYMPLGIRSDLKNTYELISETAGDNTCILVAGYPQLFCSLGGNMVAVGADNSAVFNPAGILITAAEAKEINKNVSLFNKAIENLVKDCHKDGMNIQYVSVEEAFDNHEAYTLEPYINPIILFSQSEDIHQSKPTSAYSVHPNIKGAEAYRKCVQYAIDDIEGLEHDWQESDYNPEITNTEEPTAPKPQIDPETLYVAYSEVLIANECEMRTVENGICGPTTSSAVEDLNGDGIPELLILRCSEGARPEESSYFYIYADLSIYTVMPENEKAVEILQIPNIISCGGATVIEPDVILLTNGNLLIKTYLLKYGGNDGADEFYYEYYTEYALENYVYQQINRLVFQSTDGSDGIFEEYSINDEAVSESEFTEKINQYRSMFSSVLAMNSSYDSSEIWVPSFKYLSDWKTTILDTPSSYMSFDEAWETIVSFRSTEKVISMEKAKEVFARFWDAKYKDLVIQSLSYKFSEEDSDDYTCVFIHNAYVGAQTYEYIYYYIDLTTGIASAEYYWYVPEDSAGGNPGMWLTDTQYNVFSVLDYL